GPADGKQAESRAVQERHGRLTWIHAVDGDGDDQGGDRGSGPGPRCEPAARHEQVEQYQDRQRGEEGGDDLREGDEAVERVELLYVNVTGPEHEGEYPWGGSWEAATRRILLAYVPDASALSALLTGRSRAGVESRERRPEVGIPGWGANL